MILQKKIKVGNTRLAGGQMLCMRLIDLGSLDSLHKKVTLLDEEDNFMSCELLSIYIAGFYP